MKMTRLLRPSCGIQYYHFPPNHPSASKLATCLIKLVLRRPWALWPMDFERQLWLLPQIIRRRNLFTTSSWRWIRKWAKRQRPLSTFASELLRGPDYAANNDRVDGRVRPAYSILPFFICGDNSISQNEVCTVDDDDDIWCSYRMIWD